MNPKTNGTFMHVILHTRVPDTKSTPFLAWCKACNIVTNEDLASPSS
jgi:hypothetical protein